uniref:Uncharacterized protein n=1 Tax=Rhizophora mucronata TaxID=61149 RepID=A0A2P2L1G0_RHIMU
MSGRLRFIRDYGQLLPYHLVRKRTLSNIRLTQHRHISCNFVKSTPFSVFLFFVISCSFFPFEF